MNSEEFKNMSDEEVKEMNRKLAGKVAGRFALLMTIKWVVIFGSIYAARKYLESKVEENDSSE